MANLPNDELPSKFDVVVDGTGLIQSILSAAIVRTGKSVLHLDRNGYYGEHWGSFMHRELRNWMNGDQVESPETPLSFDTNTISLPLTAANPVSNLVEVVPDHTEAPPKTNQPTPEENTCLESVSSHLQPAAEDTTEESSSATASDEQGVSTEESKDPVLPSATDDEQGSSATEDNTTSTTEQGLSSNDQATSPANEQGPSNNKQGSPTQLSWDSMQSQWRTFSFDLIPKVLYCRGAMVELLTQSNCSRYTEFKAVGKVYRLFEGNVEQVPCSRADLFSSQAVSMLEKRRMMKFLSFCSDYTSQPDAFQEFSDAPFEQFLQSRGLPDKVIDYIAHSIAMVGRKAPTLQALEATKIFLTSLGRFGNAPFLYPVFGVGELGQAFCRLCAVYGGVYCLRRWVAGMEVTDDHVSAVVCSTGQRIETSAVICSASNVRDTLNISEHLRDEVVSRAMVVTDGPLPGTDGKVALVTVPPLSMGASQTYPISVLQLDPSSNCSAPGTYLLHFVCSSTVSSTAQIDLEPVIKTLIEKEGGPRVLWSLFFNLSLCLVTDPVSATPRGVFVTSDPDTSLNYEGAVKEARRLFEELCPGEEFLPTPPDPKDIVYETPTDSTDPSPTDNTDPSPTDSTDASHTDNTDDPNSDDNPNTDPAAGSGEGRHTKNTAEQSNACDDRHNSSLNDRNEDTVTTAD